MIVSKHVGAIAALSMCICILLCGLIVYGANSFDAKNIPEYEKRIFNGEVMAVDIMTGGKSWQEFIKGDADEGWIPGDIVINGERFGMVGIKVKDYGLKFKFNKFIKGQTYYGLDTFSVYENLNDITHMKDYIANDIMDFIGVTTPLVNYAAVSVNGNEHAFGIAVERYEKAFLGRAYNTVAGELHIGGSWIKDYSGFDIENLVDVDAALRYLAAHTVIANLDCYAGGMPQNYYIYERGGKVSLLPWDYGLAFESLHSERVSNFVSFPEPAGPAFAGASLDGGPLLSKLLEIDECMRKYHGYVKQIVEGYFESGLYESKIRSLDAKINNYIKNGFSALCTQEQYQDSLSKLIELCRQRAVSIKWHLEKAVVKTYNIHGGAKVIFDQLTPLSGEAFSDNPPEDSVTTRASAVSVLYDMAGNPCVCELPNPFSDVAPGAWYKDAVKWAEATGIVRGIGEGKYAPEEPVAAQDMAAILDNFYRYMGD